MRSAGYGLLVLGIIVGILGLVNHFVIKANPIAHTSTIVGVVAGVLVVVGLLMSFMGGRNAS